MSMCVCVCTESVRVMSAKEAEAAGLTVTLQKVNF